MNLTELLESEKKSLEETFRTLFRAGKTVLRGKSYYDLMKYKSQLKTNFKKTLKTLSPSDRKKAEIDFNLEMDKINTKMAKLLQAHKKQAQQEKEDRKAEKLGKKILKMRTK